MVKIRMKTGTITFHAPNNNGSFFQAYALQRVLVTECGVQNTIIDYRPHEQTQRYSLFKEPKGIRDIVRNIYSLLHYFPLKRRYERFELMRKKYLNMSERATDIEGVLTIGREFDVDICGSDQIWSIYAREFSEAYFLPGIKNKISYAASLGAAVGGKELLKELLDDFRAISVRERTGGQYLAAITGRRDIAVLPDPTLLLKKEEYFELFDEKPLLKGDYILLYTMNYSDEILKIAKFMSDRMNCRIVAPFCGYSALFCMKYGIKITYDTGPEEFLNLMYHARFVVTNSFHGLAFSLIFEKPFCRAVHCEKGRRKRDERLDCLLEECLMEERNVFDLFDAEQVLERKIDWMYKRRILEEKRSFAIKWLTEKIEDMN